MSDVMNRLNEVEENMRKMARSFRGIRRKSRVIIMGLPLYDIAFGPDLDSGQIRGHAKGIVAIGDIATGWLAIGGLARGFVAIGGCAMGVLAIGGAAFGIVALGGAALGLVAIGGGAIGYYATGGGAIGAHVLSGTRQDPGMLDLLKIFFPGSAGAE